MSENHTSEVLKNYEVPLYKEPKMKLLTYIISFFYLVFVCLPLFLIIYVLVHVSFFIRDSTRYIKKNHKKCKNQIKKWKNQI